MTVSRIAISQLAEVGRGRSRKLSFDPQISQCEITVRNQPGAWAWHCHGLGVTMDAETFDIFKASIRRFVEGRLIPNEDRVEAEDEVPEDIIADMREQGLFGLSIPEEYGGLGLSMREEAAIVRELGRASLAFRSVIGTTVGIGSQG